MRTSKSAKPDPLAGSSRPETVIIGRVLAAHGVRGEMRVEPLTDDPDRFDSLSSVFIRGHGYKVTSARAHPRGVLLRLEGVTIPEDVESMRGEYIHIPAEEAAPLPEGAYYHYQLLGMRVETAQGEVLGELVAIMPLQSNDVYVVRGERGEVLLPAITDVVKEIDTEASKMVIEPVPGLLPWETEGG